MKNLIFASFLFLGTLTAQSDSVQIVAPSVVNTLTEDFYHNELAIANFFPMIFQQSWSGNMGAMYKFHFEKLPLAIRFQMMGAINSSTQMAFDNNEFLNKVPDEFNQLGNDFSNWNLGLGLQYSFTKFGKNRFQIYHFLDVFRGGTNLIQTGMFSANIIQGSNGKTIGNFNLNETKWIIKSMNLDYGLGLNYQIYKNINVQIETKIGGYLKSNEYSSTSRMVQYNLAENKFTSNIYNENKNPRENGFGLNLQPTTTIYFSYRF